MDLSILLLFKGKLGMRLNNVRVRLIMFNKLMMVCFGIGRGIWVLIMVKFKKSIKFIVGLAIVIVKVC